MENTKLNDAVLEYLKNTTLEQVRIDWADVQTKKDDKPITIESWLDFLKKSQYEDIWAYEFYSLSLRAMYSKYETDRPQTLEELQNECMEDVDYCSKHKDKVAKEFAKTANLDKYAILDSVKEKWYKKWKR